MCFALVSSNLTVVKIILLLLQPNRLKKSFFAGAQSFDSLMAPSMHVWLPSYMPMMVLSHLGDPLGTWILYAEPNERGKDNARFGCLVTLLSEPQLLCLGLLALRGAVDHDMNRPAPFNAHQHNQKGATQGREYKRDPRKHGSCRGSGCFRPLTFHLAHVSDRLWATAHV